MEEVVRLYTEERMPMSDIGKRFGFSYAAIHDWLEAAKVPIRGRGPITGQAKTTERAARRALLTDETCSVCGETKPRSHFALNRKSPAGITKICRACHSARTRQRQLETPGWAEYEQARARLRRYGITVQQYDALLETQGGVCAICKGDGSSGPTKYQRLLVVDHDHTTGVIRALLCNGCNQGIGGLRHSPALLRAAADYLEAHSALPTAADTR